MDPFEAHAGVNQGADDLPTGKVKAWLPPNVPRTVTVANSNQSGNLAHREGRFQVKFPGNTAWEDDEPLGWDESRSYETGMEPLMVRNSGRVTLSIRYN
jgi:hypothetical protein